MSTKRLRSTSTKSNNVQRLELLAPAKDLECGIAAIDSGADAVYIGAQRFGARASAGNSVADIAKLCDYAHQFGARVHVTVNTIIYDSEIDDTMRLVRKLADIGADALLVQDMGLLSRIRDERIPIELHASTQCDTRTPAKVKWLQGLGFGRAVLARELSADEIAAIHAAVPGVELEVFIHGALCVSYSGVCYASQHCFGRSANRGECAQFCRLAFDLKDSDGRTIERQRHLLSLKDMCQIDNLEALAAAGACAFKIEGRLKDVGYVKNVVSAYSRRLDDIIRKHPGKYRRESFGRVSYNFEPNLRKTFNRGYTTYFVNGRRPDIFSPDTPKALGEFVGHVKEIRHDSFNVAGTSSFANGDGLCFINADHELEGFRVNRAVGNRLYPYKMPRDLKAGVGLYRNNDQAFERILAGKTSERRIPIDMRLAPVADGFSLTVAAPVGVTGSPCDIFGGEVTATIAFDHQQARTPQHDNIVKQLSKLGNTNFEANKIDIAAGAGTMFIPSSLLADLRREAIGKYTERLVAAVRAERLVDDSTRMAQPRHDAHGEAMYGSDQQEIPLRWQPEYGAYPYLYNIANKAAIEFYERQGLAGIRPAFEISEPHEPLIMQCRHCLRYSLGFCVRRGGKRPTWHEPLFLELPDRRRFRLEFKCDECQMNIYAE